MKISYYDEEIEKEEQIELNLDIDTMVPNLNKYSIKLELDSL